MAPVNGKTEACDAERPTLGLADGPLREKTWDERGIEEKVEAVRRVLVDLAFQFRAADKRVDSLMRHVHVDGKIHTPIQTDAHVELPFWAKALK
jgi:hypothetical protein